MAGMMGKVGLTTNNPRVLVTAAIHPEWTGAENSLAAVLPLVSDSTAVDTCLCCYLRDEEIGESESQNVGAKRRHFDERCWREEGEER